MIEQTTYETVYRPLYTIDKGCIKISEEVKKSFFQPIRYEKLPKDFIFEGHIYTKCMDGMYRYYKDVGHYQAMSKVHYAGSILPENLLIKLNESTLPVFEIKRYE